MVVAICIECAAFYIDPYPPLACGHRRICLTEGLQVADSDMWAVRPDPDEDQWTLIRVSDGHVVKGARIP